LGFLPGIPVSFPSSFFASRFYVNNFEKPDIINHTKIVRIFTPQVANNVPPFVKLVLPYLYSLSIFYFLFPVAAGWMVPSKSWKLEFGNAKRRTTYAGPSETRMLDRRKFGFWAN
jgi:hypothetical protein